MTGTKNTRLSRAAAVFSVIIFTAAITAMDFITPLGYGGWALYIFPILLLSTPARERLAYIAAVVITILLGVGLVFSASGIPLSVAILNRGAVAVIFWIALLIQSSRNRALGRERVASTDRDRLLAENRRQRAFFEKVLEETPVGIAVVRGAPPRYEYCNRYYASIAGKPVDAIIGRGIPAIFPDYVERGGLAIIEQVMRTGEPAYVAEVETYVGFGENRRKGYFNASFVPLAHDSQSAEPAAIIVAADITDLAASRRQIEETAARDEAILNNITDGLVILAPDGEIVYINPAGLHINGYDRAAEAARPLHVFPETWDIFDENGTKLPISQWPLALALKKPFRNKIYRVKRLDTDLDKFCSYSGRPLYDQRGNLTAAVATFQDITELKTSEQLLRQREQQYKTLAENSPEVIARFDTRLRHTYLNAYGEKVYGLSREEVIGRTNAEIGMPDEKVRFWNEHFRRVLQSGRLETVNFHFNSPTFGDQRFSSLFVPEFGENAKVSSILAITRDITEQSRAEEELRKSENRLRILNENLENTVVRRTEQVRALSRALTLAEQRERKRFSYILHENLQQLLLGAKMLLGQHLRDHTQHDLEDGIDDVADGLAILEKALSTTRSLSVELNPPILRSQGLDTALRWLADHMRASYDLHCELHGEEALTEVRDEQQLMLTQMVRELLDNVIQHARTHEVRIDSRCENGQAIIVVSDHGRGFEPETVLSGKSDETRGGLLTMRERLELFGGRFSIDSEPGRGATVSISLPASSCGRST